MVMAYIKYVSGGYLIGENVEKFKRLKRAINDDFKKNGIVRGAKNGDVVAILMRLGFDEAVKIYRVDVSDL